MVEEGRDVQVRRGVIVMVLVVEGVRLVIAVGVIDGAILVIVGMFEGWER